MKYPLPFWALPLLFLLATACSKKETSVSGEGPIEHQDRPLSHFSSVRLNGAATMSIHPAAHPSVTVSGYENLISLFETKVEGEVLILQFNDQYKVKNSNIHIDIYTDVIEEIKINGSGSIFLSSGWDIPALSVKINGSGKFESQQNHFRELHLSINGSADMDTRLAVTNAAFANISGSGKIRLRVTDYLKANINGSGEIDYWGNPGKTDIQISGSGKVRKQ